VREGLDFPRTHSLVVLMDVLESAGLEIPSEVKAANVLTQYAVQARYPSWDEKVPRQNTNMLCSWLVKQLSGHTGCWRKDSHR
jgi:HEPN domain-containing protein